MHVRSLESLVGPSRRRMRSVSSVEESSVSGPLKERHMSEPQDCDEQTDEEHKVEESFGFYEPFYDHNTNHVYEDDVEVEDELEEDNHAEEQLRCTKVCGVQKKKNPVERKRSGLFRALSNQKQQTDEWSEEGNTSLSTMRERRIRNRTTAQSAPELFRRSHSRSVLEDMNCTEPGEFRKCLHCKSVFPFIRNPNHLPAQAESLRYRFCSGECHLTYVTFYHMNQNRQQQKQQQQV